VEAQALSSTALARVRMRRCIVELRRADFWLAVGIGAATTAPNVPRLTPLGAPPPQRTPRSRPWRRWPGMRVPCRGVRARRQARNGRRAPSRTAATGYPLRSRNTPRNRRPGVSMMRTRRRAAAITHPPSGPGCQAPRQSSKTLDGSRKASGPAPPL
jgi:hypothetical protein